MFKKIHYGWFIVIACMFLNAIGTGIFSSIFGLFFPSIVETYGYSQAAVAGIISIAIFAGLFSTGIFSKLYQKYSTRHLVLIFGLMNGLSYIMMSQAENLVMMYVIGAFIGIFGMGATALSAPMLITKWFSSKRGSAMGIAVAGAGLGPALMTPVITQVLATSGHKLGFVVLGAMVLGSMVLSFLIIRNNPSDKGLKAYGEGVVNEEKDNPEVSSYDYTLKEAVKTKMFYGFLLFIIVICTSVQGVLLQVPSYFTSVGFSVTQIGTLISIYALTASFGKIIIGYTFDKVGVFKGNFVFFTLITAAMIALIATENTPNAAYIYVIFAGLGLGITPVAVPLLVSILFGSKHYSSLYPLFMVSMSFGAIVGGIIAGTIIDNAGYQAFLTFGLVGFLLAFVIIQFTMVVARQTHKKTAELKLKNA
jgi:sugar phosphate permease